MWSRSNRGYDDGFFLLINKLVVGQSYSPAKYCQDRNQRCCNVVIRLRHLSKPPPPLEDSLSLRVQPLPCVSDSCLPRLHLEHNRLLLQQENYRFCDNFFFKKRLASLLLTLHFPSSWTKGLCKDPLNKVKGQADRSVN